MSTPRNYTIAKWLMGAAACAILGFGLMSFQDSARKKQQRTESAYAQSTNDTVPDKQISENFDKVMKEVSEALGQVGKELKKMDWSQINKEVENALKDVNVEKIMTEVRQALEKVDVAKISSEINEEMRKLDKDKLKSMQKELDESMKELKEINWNEINEQLKELKNVEIKLDKENLKAELEKIKPVIEKKMEELKEEMKKIEKEQKKANKSGYACNGVCPLKRLQMDLDTEFTPEIPVEPMI